MKNNHVTQRPAKNCKHFHGGTRKRLLTAIVMLGVLAATGGCVSSTTPTATSDTAEQTANNEPQQPVDSEKDTSVSPESPDAESVNAETTETSSTTDSSTGINEEKFDSIQNGMTYDEVVELIGTEGTSLSESEVSGIVTEMYSWESSDGFGNATITFQDGIVINKSQIGISSGDDVKITLEQYDSIENGMSYEDVVSLIGGEGSLLSDSEIAGSTSQIYMWEGSSLGSNANVTFSDGKVISKAQFGLE